jgi:hypothetical protein
MCVDEPEVLGVDTNVVHVYGIVLCFGLYTRGTLK